MSDIQTLMRSANPIPDPQTEFGQDDLDALLLLTTRRSGDMDVKEVPTRVRSDEPKRRGWLVAAAAFAGVILVLAAAVALSRSSDEAPPATTPPTTEAAVTSTAPTTTTVVGAPSESDVGGILSAWNTGTEDAVLATLADDARVEADVLDEVVFWTLVGQQWNVTECSTDTTPTIRCTTENVNPLYEAVGYRPWQWELSMRIEDGAVTSLSTSPALNRPDLSDDFSEAWFAYMDWLAANHPETRDQIAFPLQPSMASAFSEYLEDFRLAAGAGDLGPQAQAVISDYTNAMNSGDPEALRSLFDPGAVRVTANAPELPTSLDKMVEEMLALVARQSVTELTDCIEVAQGVQCTLTVTGPVEEAVYGGSITGRTTLVLDPDGLILEIRAGELALDTVSVDRFLDWVEANDPDVYQQLLPTGLRELLAYEGSELWLEWSQAWVEAGRP